MNDEEFTREFEKAPKNLIAANPKELLFAEDYPEGRMHIVCAAMDKDIKALRQYAQRVMAQPEGGKHLVRALNNLKSIDHHGAIAFAQAIFEALDADWDRATQWLKFTQMLDAVSEKLRTGLGWIDEKAAQMLDDSKIPQEDRIQLWLHWCAAVLRSSPEAAPLIENVAALRPQNLSKSQCQAIRAIFKDEKASWDMRSAAMYLMLGNRLISMDDAQSFVDEAYASFPLEALEGVEILAIAVENDASALAEFDVIQAKLAQIRKENLYLRDMNEANFVDASKALFSELRSIPKTALDIAIGLQAMEKHKRMIATALIDDARLADWLLLAKKFRVIKPLCALFFENFCADNPVLTAMSIALVHALLEQCNADALEAEAWDLAADQADVEALVKMQPQWVAFCKQ